MWGRGFLVCYTCSPGLEFLPLTISCMPSITPHLCLYYVPPDTLSLHIIPYRPQSSDLLSTSSPLLSFFLCFFLFCQWKKFKTATYTDRYHELYFLFFSFHEFSFFLGHVDDIVAYRRNGQHSHQRFLEWWFY